jgi:uncharacterized protein involved in exopolysaccharide biosynthesis
MPQTIIHDLRHIESAGQISLPELHSVVWRGKWHVIGVTLLAGFLGGVFLAVVQPTYEIQARLLVEQRGMPLEQVSADPRGNKEFVATQAEVVRSPAVVGRAVESHALQAPDAPETDPVTAILEELHVAPVLGTNVLSVQYVSIDPEHAQKTVQGIIESYRAYLHEHEEDSQIEAIELLTKSEKELRMDLAQRERDYIKLREQSPLLGGQGRDAVDVQISQVTQLGQTLHSVTSRRLELSNLLDAMREANRVADTRVADRAQYVAMRTASSEGRSTLNVQPASFTTEGLIPRFTQQTQAPDLVAIQQELSRARTQLQQLSSEYGSRHPSVRSAEAQAKAWNDRLAEFLRSAPATLEQELAALARQERQLQELYDAELKKAKSVDSYLIREQQALDGITRVQAMHSSLLQQLQHWQLTEQAIADGRSRITFRVLEEPVAAEEPAWPKPKLVLAVSLALGLCAGLALVFVRDSGSARALPH